MYFGIRKKQKQKNLLTLTGPLGAHLFLATRARLLSPWSHRRRLCSCSLPSLPYLSPLISPLSLFFSLIRASRQPTGLPAPLPEPVPAPQAPRASASLQPPCTAACSSHPRAHRAMPRRAASRVRADAARCRAGPARIQPAEPPSSLHAHDAHPARPRSPTRPTVSSINGVQILHFFLLPLFLSLVTDALMAFEDRRRPHELPGWPSLSPPSLYKRVASLSLLPTQARPISLSLSSPLEPPLPSPEFIIAGALEFAGATPSAVQSRAPALLHPTEPPSNSPLHTCELKVEDDPKYFINYFWFDSWIVYLVCCNMNTCDPQFMCMCVMEFLVEIYDY
jgi:hypothetical protein